MEQHRSTYKGDRDAFYTRPPKAVGAIIRERAKELDLAYGDYISAILSEYVGLSHLMPMPQKPQAHDLLAELGLLTPQETDMPRTA
jgi:hypothetical protein